MLKPRNADIVRLEQQKELRERLRTARAWSISNNTSTTVAWLVESNMTQEDISLKETFLSGIENDTYKKEWSAFFDEYVTYWDGFIEVCGQKIKRNWEDSALRWEWEIDFSTIPDYWAILESMPGLWGKPSVWDMTTNSIMKKYNINEKQMGKEFARRFSKRDFFNQILWFWYHSCEPFIWGGVDVEQGFYWNSLGKDGKSTFLHLHSKEWVSIREKMWNSPKYSVRNLF